MEVVSLDTSALSDNCRWRLTGTVACLLKDTGSVTIYFLCTSLWQLDANSTEYQLNVSLIPCICLGTTRNYGFTYSTVTFKCRIPGQCCLFVVYNTYLLTPWSRVLLDKLAGLQLVKKFPAFYGTRRFLTALTSFRHLSLSWARPIQSSYPNPTSWRSILILSSHLRLGPPSGLFPSGFPTSTLYTPLPTPIRATCPAHLILLNFITRTILGDEYKPFSSTCYLRQYD